MYPKTRAKGGSNDGSDAGGVAPTSPPLTYDAVATAANTGHAGGDSAYSPSHSTPSYQTSVGNAAGGRGSSQASPTHHYAQQHQMQQQAPPPPPMPGGSYYESGFDRAGPSPGAMQQQQQPPYYGANTSGPYNAKHRRGGGSPYDQPPPPPPPPPVAMHGGGYQGDWGMPSGGGGPMMGGGATPLGSPAGLVSGPGGVGAAPSPFSQHSRTSSTNVMGSILPGVGGGPMGGGGAEYRPPPMYGDVTGGAMPGLNASTGNNSFASMGRGGAGGPNSASMNSSVLQMSSPSRRPSHMVPTAGQAPPPPPPPPPPQMGTPAGAPAPPGGGAHVMPVRYHEPGPQMYPSAAPSVSGAAPGVSSLKITVGGGGLRGMPTSAPLSPLINSPPTGSHPQSAQPAPLQQLQQAGPPPPTPLQQRSADRGGNSVHRAGVEGGKGVAHAEAVPMPSLTGPDTNTEAETAEDEGSCTGVARTTVAQAEARYQYLYEEFHKASRVRSKLTEENDRLKREHAMLREELDYYRRKTASAAEEREAILTDYRDDVRHALRVVQALASDAAAAAAAARAGPGYASGSSPAACPQQVLEAVLARLSTASTPGASSSTVHPPPPPPPLASTANTAAQSAPSSPSLSVAGSVGGGALPPLADRLGLRCGQWMARPAGVPPPTPPLDEDAGDRHRATGSHLQGVLLRDEVRDVHRGVHAAISAYMTSLDYGFAPVAGQRSVPSSTSQGPPYQHPQHPPQQLQQLSTPNLFSSEYRGLHVFVDVPRFHGHTHSAVSELSNPGAATAGGDGAGEHNTPVLGVNSQLPPQHHQLQQQQQLCPPSPYSSSQSRSRAAATPMS